MPERSYAPESEGIANANQKAAQGGEKAFLERADTVLSMPRIEGAGSPPENETVVVKRDVRAEEAKAAEEDVSEARRVINEMNQKFAGIERADKEALDLARKDVAKAFGEITPEDINAWGEKIEVNARRLTPEEQDRAAEDINRIGDASRREIKTLREEDIDDLIENSPALKESNPGA